MTAEERGSYQPSLAIAGRRWETDDQLNARWEQARKVARQASELLRTQFNATRVILFGSLSHRRFFTPWSDIDLAVWGIPKERFFAAVSAVISISEEFKIDIVDPETCQTNLLKAIEENGIEI
jgi:predicted nucleotidyltransferase